MSGQERRRSLDQLASIPDSAERLILATGRYIGEGFDDARLEQHSFWRMPVSWKGHADSVTAVGCIDVTRRRLRFGSTTTLIVRFPMLLRMFREAPRGIPCDRIRTRRGAAGIRGTLTGGTDH